MNSDRPASSPKLLLWTEWAAGLVASGIAVWLHHFNFRHAGGLWRDEVGGVGLATSPTLRELWTRITLDAFPLGTQFALRTWDALGLGNSDAQWRMLGLIIGLLLLATMWFSAFAITRRPATVTLALLATNYGIIRWGDSLRGYGLGCVFLLLTLGAIWRLVQEPKAFRFALAAVFAVLSVQTLYANAFLLLGICCGAWAICLPQKNWRVALRVTAVGIIAAVTLLPYVPGMIASQKWWALQKSGFRPPWIWERFYLGLSFPTAWQPLVWLVVFVFALIVGFAAWRKRDDANATQKIFGLTTLLAGLVFFILFIWLTGLPTQPWYFIPLLALSAACLNVILNDAFSEFGYWRLGLLIVMVLGSIYTLKDALRTRMTNADSIFNQIATEATADDLIVVQPWYAGTTVQRYYRGAARWTTTPQLADFRMQRFDLLREKMIEGNAAAPVLAECEKTLAAGHRVWLVGMLYWFQIPLFAPEEPPPPPTGPEGWNEAPYENAWFGQVSHFLTINSADAPRAVIPPDTEAFERFTYLVFEGKQPGSAPAH